MAAFVRITLMTVYLTLVTTIHCARMESITTRVFVSLVSLQPKLVTGIIYTVSTPCSAWLYHIVIARSSVWVDLLAWLVKVVCCSLRPCDFTLGKVVSVILFIRLWMHNLCRGYYIAMQRYNRINTNEIDVPNHFYLNIGTIYSVTTETGDLFRGQDITFLHKSPYFIGNYIIRKDQSCSFIGIMCLILYSFLPCRIYWSELYHRYQWVWFKSLSTWWQLCAWY